MRLALFESAFQRRARVMPVPIYGMRRTQKPFLNSKDVKALVFSILTLISSSAVLAVFLVHIIFSSEPFTISDSLKDIRLAIRRLNKQELISKLTIQEQAKLASQVHFVSEIIGRSNRTADKKELALSIVSESMRADIDPLFIAAVVKSESTFRSSVTSNKGARGLMQLLPQTAKFTELKLIPVAHDTRRASTRSLHHIDYNLQLGIAYLKHLQELFSGNKELALIAYNWGPGNLLNALKNRSHIPQETREYAKKILKNHKLWQRELMLVARNTVVTPKEIA